MGRAGVLGRGARTTNGQFTSFQPRSRELEKEVKDLEQVVSLAATKADGLQLQLNLSDRHLGRRAKQVGSLGAELPAQTGKAWASGQAAAQAECAKMKRRFTRRGLIQYGPQAERTYGG